MAGTQMVCLRRLLLNTAFLILLSGISLASERRCHWCGPRAEQVHRSQRAPDCSSYADHIIDCEPPNTHCAIVLTAPPYAESRICVKLYQDECYPVYCNTTRVWKMTCPCRGDLCNGAKTAREEDAYNVLMKLVKNQNKIIKRSALLSGPKEHSKMLNPDDTDGNEIEAHVPQEEPQMAGESTESFSPSADNLASIAPNPETTSTDTKEENTTPIPEIKETEKTTMATENTSSITIITTEAVQTTGKNDQESTPEPEQESNGSNPSAEDVGNTNVEQTNTDSNQNIEKPVMKPEEEMQADQSLKPDNGPVPEPIATDDIQSDQPANSKEFTVTIEVFDPSKTSTESISEVKLTNHKKPDITTKATESNVKSAAESPTVVIMHHDTVPMDIKPSLATKMETMTTMKALEKMTSTMKPNVTGKNRGTRSQIHIWLALFWPIILKTY